MPQPDTTGVSQTSIEGPSKSKAKQLFSRWLELKALRMPWEFYWQEVSDLVLPNTTAFQASYTQGSPRTRKIYDGTAMLACAESSAGMQGLLCNPAERWFNCLPYDKQIIEDDDALLWLEILSDMIYAHCSFPYANFDPSVSEVLTSELGYGTGVIYSEWKESAGQMRFRSFPLASVYVAEDAEGRVNTVYRSMQYTAEQAVEMWGNKTPAKVAEMAKEKPDNKYTFLHIVQPRKMYNPNQRDNLNMRYESYWLWVGGAPETFGTVTSTVYPSDPEIITESGYRTFPYQCPRWKKIAGETYGRSPAMDVMPDIKTINAMSRIVLVAGEKIIDPPILIPDDGFITPFKTVPGSIIKYDSSMANVDIRQLIVPLETKGNVMVGDEMMQRKEDRIERAFHLDQFRATRKKERQSVPEIQDDRSQQMQMLAPILARQQPEFLGPMLHRIFDCLITAGMLPPAPKSLRGKHVYWDYNNQASRAQLYGKAAAIPQLTQALTPLAQINPGVMDVLDTDEAARQMATALDVSRRIIRSKRDIAAIRAQRQQQQDAAQAATNGAQMASAAKDLATAHQLATTPVAQ